MNRETESSVPAPAAGAPGPISCTQRKVDSMTDMLMIAGFAVMTLAALGLSAWSGRVIREGREER